MGASGAAVDLVHRRGGAITLERVVNLALPLAIYAALQEHAGDFGAVAAASVPPALWTSVALVSRRRVDAASVLVLAGLALSLLALAGGGSVRLLLLRDRLVTGLIGLVFLGSAAVGRPLIYQLARAGLARAGGSELAAFEALREKRRFKRTMLLMTLVWGVGLIAEAAVAALLVFAVPVPQYLVISHLLGFGVLGALGLWTTLYARRQRRIGQAERAKTLSEQGAPAPQA